MSFLAELRRRSVYRVAALYLIVGWVVLQVVDVFTEFHAPDEVIEVQTA